MMKMSLKLFYQNMAIFFNFSLTSSHLHPLQVENCGSNSRLVVDGMTMVNSASKGFKAIKVARHECIDITLSQKTQDIEPMLVQCLCLL